MTFLVFKGFNQFEDSSLSSVMENSYSFSLLGCPSLFISLSSSGTMGNLCTLFFLLMLPHGASFPHVLGNFLLSSSLIAVVLLLNARVP